MKHRLTQLKVGNHGFWCEKHWQGNGKSSKNLSEIVGYKESAEEQRSLQCLKPAVGIVGPLHCPCFSPAGTASYFCLPLTEPLTMTPSAHVSSFILHSTVSEQLLCTRYYVLQYKDGKTQLYPKPSVMLGTEKLLSEEQKGQWDGVRKGGESKERSVPLSQGVPGPVEYPVLVKNGNER